MEKTGDVICILLGYLQVIDIYRILFFGKETINHRMDSRPGKRLQKAMEILRKTWEHHGKTMGKW
jgi:hypothetical protein